MDKYHVNIEQAFYGDVGKSHGCIASTFSNSDLNSFLTAFTDRPGAIPAGIIMEPYLSGIRFDGKYVFTKTFPDFRATRGGMVFTHVLILELNDLAYIANLKDVLSYFVSQIPIRTDLDIISFSPTVPEKNETQEFPLYIQQILRNMITEKLPALFCGKLTSFEEALCAIWPGLPLGLKQNFSYTAGFSLSSLDYEKTIIYIQEDLKTILKNSIYIEDLEVQNVRIESEIEKFVLCKNVNNTFEEFINSLNIQLSDWLTVTIAVKAFQLFQKIDKNISQDEIRLLVRNILKVSPDPSSGIIVKNKIVQKFAVAISSEQNSNIKSLSNLVLDGIADGENIIASSIEEFIFKAFKSEKYFQPDVMIELLKLIDGSKNEWWHEAVFKGFSKVMSNIEYIISYNLWQIFLKSETSMVKLLLLNNADFDDEKKFIESMPKSIASITAKKVAANIRSRNWFVLHAHILLQYLSTKEAIVLQIEFERSAHSVSFEGSHLLLKSLNDVDLLDLTLTTADDFLVKEYANRTLTKPVLLRLLDVDQSIWLKIWFESLNLTKDLAYGIENLAGIWQKVVLLIKKGTKISDLILHLFSDSEYSDLSDYQDRQSIWANLPQVYLQKFMEATAVGCLEKILEGKVTIDDVEIEVISIICSDNFIRAFLNNNKANINVVLIAFSNIPGLKDVYLSDYIYYYNGQLSEFDSARLGDVVFKKKFTMSARRIFEKAKTNSQYRIALNNCKSIISFSFYENLMYGNLLGGQVSIDAIFSEILSKAIALYPQGPEHGDIWKRAGGDVSKFSNQKTREENWKLGILLLRNGGGGAHISVGSLLKKMIDDYPQNNELKELQKHIE
ncbi:hypothetical protein [uncultured Flavobacterium sp.]|uniref:GAP1-N1 domain-containing protein n=1 Tax=uncultured Flavobacterium sp. TaxID=165435 RepID=UPI002598A130|nr:hypothetical protein [uncultured Flavobacterium sp.]